MYLLTIMIQVRQHRDDSLCVPSLLHPPLPHLDVETKTRNLEIDKKTGKPHPLNPPGMIITSQQRGKWKFLKNLPISEIWNADWVQRSGVFIVQSSLSEFSKRNLVQRYHRIIHIIIEIVSGTNSEKMIQTWSSLWLWYKNIITISSPLPHRPSWLLYLIDLFCNHHNRHHYHCNRNYKHDQQCSDDVGDPLYLTDLLDRGLLEEAAQKARVDLGEVQWK